MALNVKEDDETKKIFHFKKESLRLECEWVDCSEFYPTMQSFLDHLQYHMERQPSEDLICKWKDCGHLLPTTHEFIIHTNYHGFHTKIKSFGSNLLKRKNLKECTLSGGTRNIIPELPEKFICNWEKCEETFACPESFYLHVDRHVKGSKTKNCCWEGCSVLSSNGYKLRDHLRSHTQEKQVACPTCGSLFSNRTKFIDHVKRQSPEEEQIYECSHCHKKLASERLLRDHIRNHINHYKCPFCEMTCCSPSNLSNHIKYRHDDERPFPCNYCDYSGKTQGDLCKHLETHLSSPQHHCSYENCTYVSRSGHSLKLHMAKAHAAVDVAYYSCHLCERRFARGSYLTRHLFAQHAFRWPSGHCRFRYKRGKSGRHELETVRYESLEISGDDLQMVDDVEIVDDGNMGNEDHVIEKNSDELAIDENTIIFTK